MVVEHIIDNFRYTFSNQKLKKGDKVYRLSYGRCLEDNSFVLQKLSFEHIQINYPEVIVNLKYNKFKSHEVKTTYGFYPKESLFKIIKAETFVINEDDSTGEWVEITIPNYNPQPLPF